MNKPPSSPHSPPDATQHSAGHSAQHAASQPAALRLFFALWPDPDVRTALTALQQRVAGKAVAYDNLHLTLAFLGQQPVQRLPLLRNVLLRLPPLALTLELNRVSYFPGQRLVWAGMHQPPAALLDLQRGLLDTLQREGIAVDAGRFQPHVTLARQAPPPEDIDFAPITWQVSDIALVQSETRPEGVRYQVCELRRLEERLRMGREDPETF